MRDHVKILAILNIVFGGVAALIGLGILLLFGGIAGLVGISAHNDPEAAVAIPILGIVGMGLFHYCPAIAFGLDDNLFYFKDMNGF